MKKRYLAILLAIATVLGQTAGTGQVVLAAQIEEEKPQEGEVLQEKEGEEEEVGETGEKKPETEDAVTADKKEQADETQNEGGVQPAGEEKEEIPTADMPEEKKETYAEKNVSAAALSEDNAKAGEPELQLNFWDLSDKVAGFPGAELSVSKDDAENCYDADDNTYPIVVTNIVSENTNIVSVKEEETEWTLELKNPGKTNITIYCCKKDDATKTFQKKVQIDVRNDMYYMNIFGDDKIQNMLFGDNMELVANVWGERQNENGLPVPIDTKDLKITWGCEVSEEDAAEIEKGIKLTHDAEDPLRCQITAPEHGYGYSINVYVKAFKEDEEVASASVYLNVNDSYDVIEPASIDTDIFPGQTIEIQNLGAYHYDKEVGRTLKGDKITFEFDPEFCEIKRGDKVINSGDGEKQDSGNYTIKRLRSDSFVINIYSWVQESGEWTRTASDSWSFDYCNYDELDFDQDSYDVFASDDPEENETIDIKLNTESIGENASVEWTVGVRGGEEYGFVKTIDPSNYTASGNTLTLNGNNIKKALQALGQEGDYLWVSVLATVKIDGVEATRAETGVSIRTPRYELESVKDKTLVLDEWMYYDKQTSCYVENKKYPDGRDIPVTLSDIVLEQEETVWEKSEEASGIILKAVGCGEAAVTFKTTSEELGEKNFTVNMSVTDDMYFLYVNGGSDYIRILPGQSRKLDVEVEHRYYDSKNKEIKEEVVKDPSPYLTYHDFNESIISVKAGIITAKPLQEEYEYADSGLRIHLSMPRDGRDNFECDEMLGVEVTSCYYQAVIEKMYVEPGEVVSSVPVKLLRFDTEHVNGIEEKGITYQLEDGWNVTLNKEKTGFTVGKDLEEGEQLGVGVIVEKKADSVDEGSITEYAWLDMEVCKHNFVVKSTKQDNCTVEGVKTLECSKCHTVKTESIPKTSHSFGAWTTTREATVFAEGEQTRTCGRCHTSERKATAKLKAFVKLNAKSIPLKVKQSTTAIKVTMEKGDSIASWKSSKSKVATVNSKGKITGKKVGTAKITVTLKSGVKATVKVKVQKKEVTTSKLSVTGKTSKIGKKLTLKKGKSAALAATVTPITSKQKVTYKSSNKKVAAVTSKGKITAKKPGKAKITVKSGKKKVVITVTVKK